MLPMKGSGRLRASRGIRLAVAIACLVTFLPLAPALAVEARSDGRPAPLNLATAGHVGGHLRAVEVSGNVAYAVSAAAGVSVFEVTGGRPSLRAEVPLPGPATSLRLYGRRLFVVTDAGLHILDVTSALSPRVVGAYALPDDAVATAVLVRGARAYLGWMRDESDGVTVIDVSDPTRPTKVAETRGVTLFDQVPTLSGTIAYAGREGGIDAIDLTRPDAPALRQVHASRDFVLDVTVAAGTAYVAYDSGNVDDGFVSGVRVVDLRTGRVLGSLTTDEPVIGLEAEGGVLYAAEVSGVLHKIDVSRPTRPVILSSVRTPAWSPFLRVLEGRAYLAAAHGLVVVESTGMKVLGEYRPFSGGSALAVSGTRAYVAGDGLSVLDVTDAKAPRVVASIDPTVPSSDVVLADGFAWVAQGPRGVAVYSIGGEPVLAGRFAVGGDVTGLVVADGKAYVADRASLAVFDVVEPTRARLLGRIQTPVPLRDLELRGTTAFAVGTTRPYSGTSRMIAVDVSDATAAKTISTIGLPDGYPRIALDDDCAYVSWFEPNSGESGLQILDVSAPMKPKLLGRYDASEAGANALMIDGDLVHLAGSEEVQSVAVGDPAAAYLEAAFPVFTEAIHAENGRIYVTGTGTGLTVLARAATSERATGSDLFETAAAISRHAIDRSDWVVLANARGFADSLAGTPLAYALRAPILPVDRDTIPTRIAAEIRRLGATRAIILGGTGVVSGAVVDQLVADGMRREDVVRIGGADRYATAAAAAFKLRELRGTRDLPQAFIATGRDFPDALAASALAARLGAPILLVDGARLPARTAQALRELGVTRTTILGGKAVVPDSVVARLPKPSRLGGRNRYDTARKVAEYALRAGVGFRHDHVLVATGLDFPDALAGGPIGALTSSPTLLVAKTLPAETAAFVAQHAESIERLSVLGAPDDVTTDVERSLVRLLQ